VQTYQYVGKLEGAFYEADSRATQRLRWVEQQAELGRQQKQHEEQQSLAYPECNMQYTVAEGAPPPFHHCPAARVASAAALPARASARLPLWACLRVSGQRRVLCFWSGRGG
jgi:hypothetical protein